MFQANNPQDNQTIKITHNANQDVQYKYEDVPTAWCAASFKLSSVYLKSVHFIPKVASTHRFSATVSRVYKTLMFRTMVDSTVLLNKLVHDSQTLQSPSCFSLMAS